MPKYYCDYCDTFLTHDSPSVRKTHNGGRKHKDNVRMFYQKWMEDQAQKLVDATAKQFARNQQQKAAATIPPMVGRGHGPIMGPGPMGPGPMGPGAMRPPMGGAMPPFGAFPGQMPFMGGPPGMMGHMGSMGRGGPGAFRGGPPSLGAGMAGDRDMVRKEIGSSFRLNAFMPKRDALDLCVDMLENFDKTKRTKWMDKIVETLRKQTLNSSVVSCDILRGIFTQISNKGENQTEKLLNVFDVFAVPRFELDQEGTRLVSVEAPPLLIPNVSAATRAFRNRYRMVLQRARRSRLLERITMVTIESLAGSSKKREHVVVLGMLTQQKADCFHIEDMTGSLQVDLSETRFQSGLYTEGAIFIFEGTYDGSILIVSEAGLVPPEKAEETRQHFGQSNWFGGPDSLAFRCNKKLAALETKSPDASIVVLSDVHLDKPEVLQALYHLWSGFSQYPPLAFVICGNFCSQARQTETMSLLDKGFHRLANQLSEDMFRKAYTNTSFIFVPGPDDPSINMILPRPNIPQTLYKHMEKVPNCTFASNPARLQYASQEIVILREDLVEKISRHTMNAVAQSEISHCFARTILSQAHLSPLPQHVAPVLWDFDFALGLHPLPDLLIVADRFKTFKHDIAGIKTRTNVADCIVANPGSFSRGSFGFQVYYPHQRSIEDSVIDLPA